MMIGNFCLTSLDWLKEVRLADNLVLWSFQAYFVEALKLLILLQKLTQQRTTLIFLKQTCK